MSLHFSKKPSLKDKLRQQEIDLRAELDAIEKAKIRAGKEDSEDSLKRGPGRPKKVQEESVEESVEELTVA